MDGKLPDHGEARINEPLPRRDVGAAAAATNAAFTRFPTLPPELRYAIWDFYIMDYEVSSQPNNWTVRFRHNPKFSLSALSEAVTAASAKNEQETAPASSAAPLDTVASVLESALNLPIRSKVPVTLLPIIPFVEGGANAASTIGEARLKHHCPLLSVNREARTRLLHTRPHLFMPIGNRQKHQHQGDAANNSSASDIEGDSESLSTSISAVKALGSLAAINLLRDGVRLDYAQVRRLLHRRTAYIPREVYQDVPVYRDLMAALPKNTRKKNRRTMYHPSVAEKERYFGVVSRLVAPFKMAALGFRPYSDTEEFVIEPALGDDGLKLVELVCTYEGGMEGLLKEVRVGMGPRLRTNRPTCEKSRSWDLSMHENECVLFSVRELRGT